LSGELFDVDGSCRVFIVAGTDGRASGFRFVGVDRSRGSFAERCNGNALGLEFVNVNGARGIFVIGWAARCNWWTGGHAWRLRWSGWWRKTSTERHGRTQRAVLDGGCERTHERIVFIDVDARTYRWCREERDDGSGACRFGLKR
jgi:hypothetical protein